MSSVFRKKTEPLPKRKTGSVFEKCREAQLRLNHKLLHVALAQAQRIENPFLAALKGLILDFDAGIAVVADIGQGGDVLAPIYVAEAGELRGHEIQRIGHHADLMQLFGEELDIFIMYVENLVFDNAFLVVYEKEYLPLVTAMAVMVTRELARNRN